VDSEPGGTILPAAELFHQQLASGRARTAFAWPVRRRELAKTSPLVRIRAGNPGIIA